MLFVLTVAAIKEIIEDRKRHQADLMTNTSITHILQPDGSFSEKEWQQVKVGDIIQVNDDDLLATARGFKLLDEKRQRQLWLTARRFCGMWTGRG